MTTGVGNTLTMGYDGLRRLTSVTGGPVTRQFAYRDIDSTKTTGAGGVRDQRRPEVQRYL